MHAQRLYIIMFALFQSVLRTVSHARCCTLSQQYLCLQIAQLMEDKESLVAQKEQSSGAAEGAPQRTLQMKGNVMNRILKYANEAILSAEEIRSMDEAAFVASLHDSTDASQ